MTFGLAQADADFDSVRLRHDLPDMSGRAGDPPGKYWHESIFHPHYDGRFTDRILSREFQHGNLSLLMQSYLTVMADIGAETWITHGSLLGWYWNGKIMPWDSDIDVQMTVTTMHFLASYYNMTIHDLHNRQYMLEINPLYIDGSIGDNLNTIDARWIDTQTGLFIDITSVRPAYGADPDESKLAGWLSSKDLHINHEDELFPLRETTYEGARVLVPYDYLAVLRREYGDRALTQVVYSGHRFSGDRKEWVPII